MLILREKHGQGLHTSGMSYLKYGHDRAVSLLRLCWLSVYHLTARMLSPMQNRARGTRRPQLWTSIAGAVVLVLAFVAQLLALMYLGYLVDLCLSLMELWAELARKHLELTL